MQGTRVGNFTPAGNTTAINVGTTSPTQLRSGGNYNLNTDLMVVNSGSNIIFVKWGDSAASTVAVAPTAGTPANGVPVLPGTAVIFCIGFATFVDAVTLAGNSLTYFTVGEGS